MSELCFCTCHAAVSSEVKSFRRRKQQKISIQSAVTSPILGFAGANRTYNRLDARGLMYPTPSHDGSCNVLECGLDVCVISSTGLYKGYLMYLRQLLLTWAFVKRGEKETKWQSQAVMVVVE